MIQVEALELIKHARFKLEAGDRLTVDDDTAARWCGAGWAKAVNGEIETGERRVVKATLAPAVAAHAQVTDEVNTDG